MGDTIPQKTSLLLDGNNGSTPESRRKGWNLRRALEGFEKELLTEALKQNLGHRGKTAVMLEIDRKTLYTKLKKYGVI